LNQTKQASRNLDHLLASNPNSNDALTPKEQAALRMRDYPLAAAVAGSQ
jgi:hypothetical protein